MVLTSQLAHVKLTRPPLIEELVHRHRLVQRLEEELKKPVTLLAAPAGYGKSTLLAEWLSNSPRRAAWLSLDESDNNLTLFCSYLIAAIQTVFPGSMRLTTGLINSAVPGDPSQLATTLSNEIAELPGEFILVLDDYHSMKAQAVHALMSDLIRRLPAPLHLIISTRTNAPLPMGKLRASGLLGELRARDLCFTLAETRDFLTRAVSGEIPAGLVQRLQDRMDGWAVGLRFATVLLRQGIPPSELLERLVIEQDHHLMEYLLDEVLSQKPPAVQEVLLKTSLLERFTLGLGDAVLNWSGSVNSHLILDELVWEDILIAEHGVKGGWYKYLDLFREFLRGRAKALLDPQTLVEIDQRASVWFLEHGLITEAIQHAIAAGNMKFAAQIVGENLHSALDQAGARPLIELWLQFFSPEWLESNVELVMARLWLASYAWKLPVLPPLLARVEQLLESESEIDSTARRRFCGDIAYHRIFLAYFGGDGPGALELLAEHQDNLPLSSDYVRGQTLTARALANQMVGKPDVALQLLTDALQRDGSPSTQFTLRVMTGFSMVYLNAGDLVNLEQNAETTLRLTKGELSLSTEAAHLALGVINYEWNRLEAAAQHFAAATELSHMGNLKVGHEGFAWLALTRQAQGSNVAANAALQRLLTFTDETHSGALLYDAEGYRARVALMQGNLDVALHWAQSVSFNLNPHMLFDIEAYLTRLRILLATHQPQHLRTMLNETDELLEAAESAHNTRRIIQLTVLQAMGRDLLGRRSEALVSLERAIPLAEPRRLLRTFLDLGPGMARLLNLLSARHGSSAYIHRILAAGAQNEKKWRTPTTSSRDDSTQLIEPLTLRELQVLQAVAQRRSNKEIASELVISPETVKAHINNIHQKLGVNNRQEAAKVALAFGIIEIPAVMTGSA